MGFLDSGNTLPWEQAQSVLHYVKMHGVEQFIRLYNECKDRHAPELLWGDELEYILACRSADGNTTTLCLRGAAILDHMLALSETNEEYAAVTWHPEYGAFMIEATPSKPYAGLAVDEVEANMKLRRALIERHLAPEEMILAIVTYPRLGAQTGLWTDRINSPFTHPPHEVGGPIAQSSYIPDQLINPHPRFGTLTANIRKRRGGKVCICCPLFVDKFTNAVPNDKHTELCHVPMLPSSPSHFFMSDAMEEDVGTRFNPVSKAPVIHMDAMAFGMGCCCLQTTFQCPTLFDARYMTDQLAVLAPYFLALTAACPIFKGLLAATDARWDVISASVDDRTTIERGDADHADGKIDKSRYDSVSCFISDSPLLNDELHNDIPLQMNLDALKRLREAGIDERLSRHVAHLFIRDPLVMYDAKIELDDNMFADHWENIQSTNWQSVRFKPPPNKSTIGWRVEFRVMEIQLTEFENAAFSVFVALMVQTIRHFNLNFYIPISKVDQNMRHSQSPNAVLKQHFTWRQHVLAPTDPNFGVFYDSHANINVADNAFHDVTVHHILFGDSKAGFKGLVAGMRHVAEHVLNIAPGSPQHAKLDKYIQFISRRASGDLMTTATWMRHFVTTHHAYNQDSVVSEAINHELLQKCDDIAHGRCKEPLLHADFL